MEIYGIIILRTIIVYILIVLIFRLMGKREIGELGILDLVVFVMIAEIAVLAIEKHDDSFIKSILPMGILVFIQMISATISLKSRKFRQLVDGEPSIIIKNGKINEKEMKKQRYNFDDLLMQLREKDVRNIADVEFALLEPTGKLSVFTREHGDNSYTVPLILDGQLQKDKLAELHIEEEWLSQELKKRGHSIKDVSICSYQNGELFIDTKNERG